MPPVERRLPATDGVHLAVRTWAGGAGAPLLLIHGLASNARLWDGCADALAVLGHPVAALDLRGHGRSDRPDAGHDFPTVAADVAAVLDGLGWTGTAVVAGQSWGGNVVVELAVRHPDAAVAVAGVDGGFLQLGRRFPTWDACLAALAPPDLSGLPATELEATFRTAHPDWPEAGIAGAMACFEVGDDGTVAPRLRRDRHLAILRSMWEEPLDEVWGAVALPVLLLACDDGGADLADKRIDVDAAAARIRDVEVRWFEAHHDVHAQRPAAVAAELHRFVERATGRAEVA